MTIESLLYYLRQGREIEFSTDERSYFLEPCYESSAESFIVYDSKINEVVFRGGLNELLKYKFDDRCSMEENIGYFEFEYIL